MFRNPYTEYTDSNPYTSVFFSVYSSGPPPLGGPKGGYIWVCRGLCPLQTYIGGGRCKRLKGGGRMGARSLRVSVYGFGAALNGSKCLESKDARPRTGGFWGMRVSNGRF